MTAWRRIAVAAALLPAAPGAAPAQSGDALPVAWEHWRFAAPVRVPVAAGPRLVRAIVPDSVSREARPGWEDLRVIDDSGREVPFVLHARTERRTREPRPARLMDLTHRPGADTRATVDLGDRAGVHNQIEIETDLRDFFVRVAIDARGTARAWRVVEPGTPVYRFAAQGLEGNQTIRYPDNSSRYLRLRIPGPPQPFPLTGARAWHEVRQEAERVPLDVAWRPDPAAPAGETWWLAHREAAGQPVSEVAFAVDRETFHRPVRIRVSDDGRAWHTAGSGEIYRLAGGDGVRARLRVAFPETRAPHLRVEMVNRSDAALTGVTLTLSGTPRRVVFQAEPGRGYRLLYGNPRAAAAQYELSRVTRAAELETAAPGAVGPGVQNRAWADPAPWTERHPAVLWGALLVAMGILGWLAVRSLRPAGG